MSESFAHSARADLPVTIAVLTYLRPAELAASLIELKKQATQVDRPVDLLVVDNDAAGSGRAGIARVDPTGLRYVIEPRPGISAARNRALDEAGTDGLLVFVDDDEVPESGWLAAMLATFDAHNCAAVAGAVVSAFAEEPDPWITAGRFFDRRRPPTGTVVSFAATNNLLLDLRRIAELDLRFDERFGQSGGSDTLFTRQLSDRGGKIIWCDEAVVIDHVPSSRLTRRWVLRRALRSGNSWSRTSIEMTRAPGVPPYRRPAVRGQLLATGGIRLAGGVARWTVGTLSRSVGQRARGLRTIARGGGMLCGALGLTYHEYARPTSRVAGAQIGDEPDQWMGVA